MTNARADHDRETTIRIRNASYDEVEARVYGEDTSCLVHGTRDGSAVCVTGEGDVLGFIRSLGLKGEAMDPDAAPDAR